MKKLEWIEVGARGGVSTLAEQHAERLHRVLVEPQPTEAERLMALSDGGKLYSVIPFALNDTDGDIRFYVPKNPTCSSTLQANTDFMRQYSGISPNFTCEKTILISCSRYDIPMVGCNGFNGVE